MDDAVEQRLGNLVNLRIFLDELGDETLLDGRRIVLVVVAEHRGSRRGIDRPGFVEAVIHAVTRRRVDCRKCCKRIVLRRRGKGKLRCRLRRCARARRRHDGLNGRHLGRQRDLCIGCRLYARLHGKIGGLRRRNRRHCRCGQRGGCLRLRKHGTCDRLASCAFGRRDRGQCCVFAGLGYRHDGLSGCQFGLRGVFDARAAGHHAAAEHHRNDKTAFQAGQSDRYHSVTFVNRAAPAAL